VVAAVAAGFAIAGYLEIAAQTSDIASQSRSNATSARAGVVAARAAKRSAETAARQVQADRAQRHAQMALGTPDGKVMEIVEHGVRKYVILYLRNVGGVTARDVTLDLWPVMTPPSIEIETTMEDEKRFAGPTIGAQSIYREHLEMFPDVAERIGDRANIFQVVGRVRWRDEFAEYYCQELCAMYSADVGEFRTCAAFGGTCVPGPRSLRFTHVDTGYEGGYGVNVTPCLPGVGCPGDCVDCSPLPR
jgi:hypothetical protein